MQLAERHEPSETGSVGLAHPNCISKSSEFAPCGNGDSNAPSSSTSTADRGGRAGAGGVSGGAKGSVDTQEGRVLVVPINVIVKKVAPLCSLSQLELRTLVESYDHARIGGLSEMQWTRFCEENCKRFATLGAQMIDFDRSGEYTLLTVEHPTVEYDDGSRKTRGGFAKGAVRFLESFVAGGVAGAVSKTVIAPADRVKIIFQVDSARSFSLLRAFNLGACTVRRYGVSGLWLGNGATIMRVVPYAAITYMSFDYYYRGFCRLFKLPRPDKLEHEHEQLAVAVRFFSGALAGVTSTVCTYPLDLMRARFAAHSSTTSMRIPSYRVAFRDAVANNGFRSLYAGMFPTVIGIMPYAGCSFACFETIKHYIVVLEGLPSDKEVPVWQRLIAGGFSGLVAQSATYPLDIVRRRMQVTPHRYRGVVHALRTIFREEGLRQGLYKGLVMNWIKGPIASAISFTVNDMIKRRTRNYCEATSEYSRRENLVTLPEAFVCGGLAAGVAKFWTIPFDRLKIMYQLGIADAEKTNARGLTQLRGLLCSSPNMWASGTVTMMRVIPYGALTYCFFDVFKTIAERMMYSHYPTPATNFLAGALAASAGTCIVYPLDLLRTRLAMNQVPTFQSYYWLFRSIERRCGVSALFEGCYLSMIGAGALAGIGFATYEALKESFHCDSFVKRLGAGMIAGIAGQIITYPLSVAKRNRQAERIVYSSVGKPLITTLLNPNFYATMYGRMPFSWALGSLTFGISFAVNDACRDLVVKARGDILHDLVFAPSTPSLTTMPTDAKGMR